MPRARSVPVSVSPPTAEPAGPAQRVVAHDAAPRDRASRGSAVPALAPASECEHEHEHEHEPSAPGDGEAEALSVTADGLVYRLDAPPRRHGRKSIVSVRREGEGRRAGLVDRCDLYAFRSRERLARLVADLFGREPGAALGHLALLLDTAERAHAEQERAEADDDALTPERRRVADELLAAPDLLERAAAAMEQLGYVGEDVPRRLAYLVATSRLLPRPLSAIVFAPSGAGKSELLETTVRLLPEGSVDFLSRLTQHALYYAGSQHLVHKLVVVDEHTGAAESDHAIRTLQSKGMLRLAAPVGGKTGEPITVHGPIALMSGTTSETLNPENLSRCLELTLDDSPEQTARVQQAQRRAASGQAPSAPDVTPWRDAQRLLEPLDVVVPFAERLTYATRTTADRRGNAKLLGLVMAHALLCQRRRERDREGRVVATREDYAVVHALLQPSLDAQAEDLSPRAARALRWLTDHGAPADRRELAVAVGWTYNTSKKALAELRDQELVRVVEPGPPARYRLVGGRSLLGGPVELTPPDALSAS